MPGQVCRITGALAPTRFNAHMTTIQASPVIRLRHISKRFPGVLANDAICLDFYRGEVHALLGENGAGKSTLIGMLAGMQQPDQGLIEVLGRAVRINSPQAALALGIGTVYQHSHLIPSLTVMENLMLGGSWLQPQRPTVTLARFDKLSQLLSVQLDPGARVEHLDLGQQQQVEIIRALWHDQNVLVLDEPTSMLTPQGVAELAEVVRRLSDHGVAVIFITHKLGEACNLAHRISVLRRGRVVGSLAPERLRNLPRPQVIEEVVAMMFDREESLDSAGGAMAYNKASSSSMFEDCSGSPTLSDRHTADPDSALISLNKVSTTAETGECPLREVVLRIWPGEIVGIAGIDGSGQKHLAEVLAGQRALRRGTVLLDGIDITNSSISQRRKKGVRYITDERLGEGTVSDHSVATNLILKEIGERFYWTLGLTRWKRIFRRAREQIDSHNIQTPSDRTPVGKLSGGNIQKVLLARELAADARLVIFNKPTYGLDLNSTRQARAHIRSGAGTRDAALVVISNELEELMQTCHRVVVLEGGCVRGMVVNRPGAEADIGRYMTAAEDV